MSQKPALDYQKKFSRLAVKRLPHHTALRISQVLRSNWLTRLLDEYARRHYIGTPKLQNFEAADVQRYVQTTQDTVLWHGTGRYQHGENSNTDVLDAVLAIGSIRPVEDAYAIFSGGKVMRSISLTRLRIIARCYADMHGQGYREPNRYGDAMMWTSYHYGMFYARMYLFHFVRMNKYYNTWHKLTHDGNGHNTWGKKANKQAEDVWDIFGLGSDIKDNYPIIFGFRNIEDTVQLSSVFRDYEVRVSRKIDLREVTHIEVPLAKIGAVNKLLTKYNCNLAVEPIELGEWVAAQRPFSQLAGLSNKDARIKSPVV